MLSAPNYNDFSSDNSTRLFASCPVCNTRYDFFQAKVIEEAEESYLVFVKCKKCQSGIVALLLNNIYGVSSIAMLTDLDYEDTVKFMHDKSLEYDDVIAMHQLLGKKRALIKCIE